MIKAKFRDHVRSKTPVAMVNEVLCKLTCHNICVLVAPLRDRRYRLALVLAFRPDERLAALKALRDIWRR
jgi:hypothetical protein